MHVIPNNEVENEILFRLVQILKWHCPVGMFRTVLFQCKVYFEFEEDLKVDGKVNAKM